MVLISRRKITVISVILLAGILLWNPVNRLAFSVHLLISMQKYASGSTGRDLAVEETKVQRRMGTRECEALLYRPSKSRPAWALILVPGISELGCYHPRLVALSRLLADMGLLVITPDIPEFRMFEITAEPIDQILFWYDQTAALDEGGQIRTTGIAGISFSGTLALMAAARPEIRDNVGFVVGIGPYRSLTRLTKEWFSVEHAASGNEPYPTRFYAKWIVMLSALDLVEESWDRLFLHNVLVSLLLQKEIPPPAKDLTPGGMRWYKLATVRSGPLDGDLARKIEEYLISRIYPQLDPEAALDQLRCPVFLMHGAYDDLISARESVELHRRIASSHLLITPFLTHTHPTGRILSGKQKAIAGLDALLFCYQFSRALP